jgi:hypothetical protein
MGIYDTRARGLWVDGGDEVTPTDLVGQDYLIAKVGTKFHANVQKAYDAGIPLIMFYQFRPEIWEGSTLSEASWPADQNVCLTECRQWIMSGVAKRAIHGIIVDCSEPNPRNKTDVGWLTRPSKLFLSQLWNEFKLPTYLYMNQNPLGYYTTQTGKDTLYGFVASQDGMSTSTFVATNAGGLPLDTTKPLMSYNNTKVWFWLYKILGSRIATLYMQGTKTALYSDLNFVGGSNPPPVVDPTVPPVVIPGTDLTAVNAKLDAILAAVNRINSQFT